MRDYSKYKVHFRSLRKRSGPKRTTGSTDPGRPLCNRPVTANTKMADNLEHVTCVQCLNEFYGRR